MTKIRHISLALGAFALLLSSTSLAADHQARQARPIQLGTSGGNVNDRSNAFCCSGTLGSLVASGGTQYVLSNNHVLAEVNGGSAGDPVNQPGLIDVGCQNISGDYVANLSQFVTISFNRNATNRVDCAIAQVIAGAVATDGSILDVGVPSSVAKNATVGLAVQKSGRTSGLTTGTVTGVNGTFGVQYQLGCGKGAKKVANFTGQVVFSNISSGGDSGSLILTQGSCAQPVALLFAGSSSSTIGNPIGEVYAALGVSPVGQSCGSPLGAENVDFAIQHAIEVQNRITPALLDVPGIVGTSVGQDANGRAIIQIYLERDDLGLRNRIQAQFEDVPSRIEISGPMVAY